MILRYELIKILCKKANRFLIVISIFLILVMSYFAFNDNIYVNSKGVEEKGVLSTRNLIKEKNEYKGYMTSDIFERVILNRKYNFKKYKDKVPNKVFAEDMQKNMDIEFFINSVLGGYREYDYNSIIAMRSDDSKNIYKIKERKIKKQIPEYANTPQKIEFLKKIYMKQKTPFYYEAYNSWDTMIRFATNIILVLILLVTLPCSMIFSDEFGNGAESIYFSTKYGRSKGVIGKIMAGLIFSSGFYWISMILFSAILMVALGISGADVMYQVDNPYSMYNITFSQEYMILLLSGYIGIILSASMSMLIGAYSKSSALAVVFGFITFATTPFIARVIPFKLFFMLTPDQLVNVLNTINAMSLIQIGNVVFRQIPFIMFIYCTFSIFIIIFTYKIYKRKSIV